MKKTVSLAILLGVMGMGLASTGCATAPKGEAAKDALRADADAAMLHGKAADTGLADFLSNSYGYVVFPDVGKGGFIVGGSYGRGLVYEQGKFVGWADISQATIGLQAGGQSFSEILVFQDKEALGRFKYGKVKFAANASAVALKAGAAASAKYSDGVAVFVQPKAGLMFEASIGGQEFSYRPASE